MENQYKERLEKLVIESSLQEDRKYLWQLFLKISTDEENEAVFEAASEGNENLILLSKHLEDKLWDMKENNKYAWEKLVEDESEFAEQLS